ANIHVRFLGAAPFDHYRFYPRTARRPVHNAPPRTLLTLPSSTATRDASVVTRSDQGHIPIAGVHRANQSLPTSDSCPTRGEFSHHEPTSRHYRSGSRVPGGSRLQGAPGRVADRPVLRPRSDRGLVRAVREGDRGARLLG